MIPKVEGPWDIHYVDRLLAQLEAKAGLERPILMHAMLETAQGVANLEEIAAPRPRIQGMSFGPADLAASRRMKTTRVGGGHPGYRTIADPDPDDPEAPAPELPAGPLALLDRAHGRRLHLGRRAALLRPLRRHPRRARAARRSSAPSFLLGCVGAWSLHPAQIAIAKRVFSPDPERSRSPKR